MLYGYYSRNANQHSTGITNLQVKFNLLHNFFLFVSKIQQLKVEGGRTTRHHEQTQMYINIILENATLKLIMDQATTFAAENTLNEKMLKAWQKLQSCVDQLWDEKMGFDRGFKGLKQVCLSTV